MNRCPRCGSTHVETNKFETIPFSRISPGVHAMRGAGHPIVATGTILAWAAGHALNAVIDDWRCADCQLKFS